MGTLNFKLCCFAKSFVKIFGRLDESIVDQLIPAGLLFQGYMLLLLKPLHCPA